MDFRAIGIASNPLDLLRWQELARYLRLIRLSGAFVIFLSPLWIGALFFTSTQNTSIGTSIICVVLMAIIATVVILHLTQNDFFLRQLMLVSLPAHMAASSLFLWVSYSIYQGAADTFHYWTVGLYLADKFQIRGWSVFQPPYWSTNLINNICGMAVLVIGDSLPAFFIASCIAAFAGGYLYYRVFRFSFPEGDIWLFGMIVMLSPSLLFWPSAVGKDSLIQFTIGLACYGYARLVMKPSPMNILFCSLGLMGTLMVRAHVAAMLGMAMALPYAIGRSKRGRTNVLARALLIPVLLGGSYFLISEAKNFIDIQNDNSNGVLQQANEISKNSQLGGSSFNQGTSLVVRLIESPFLPFRPFPWEMHSVMAIPAAGESIGLILLCWYRRREIWSTLRNWRDPLVGFLLTYVVIFTLVFGASISNFGIILRQRIMMMPALFMLVCAKRKLAELPAYSRARQRAWPGRPIGVSTEM